VILDCRLSEPDCFVQCECTALIRATLKDIERAYMTHIKVCRKEARQRLSDGPGRNEQAEVA
jgi:hypothetical protein